MAERKYHKIVMTTKNFHHTKYANAKGGNILIQILSNQYHNLMHNLLKAISYNNSEISTIRIALNYDVSINQISF